MTAKIKCPRCGSKKQIAIAGYLQCKGCGCLFDDEPVGDYSDHDPSARMQREEAALERRIGATRRASYSPRNQQGGRNNASS
jgi:transcription initiation factor TFIIIB Brf1 subunit/transcription initiation factor TFIIB